MSFLLDTNIISEMARTKPHPGIERWFRNVPGEALHLSVLTLGEIRKGIEPLENRRAAREVAGVAGE